MPLREYRCLECGGKIETITATQKDGSDFVLHLLEWCGCEKEGVRAEEIIFPAAIRFKGPGFHCNDYGQPKNWTGSTRSRYRMRKEIRDAYDAGELKPGENPFNSNPTPPKKLQLDDLYGEGAEKPITQAMKDLGSKGEAKVKLPSDKTVMISRKDKTHFGLSEAKDVQPTS